MKFKYGDKVKIVKGFHKGMTGKVVSESKILLFEREYLVSGIKFIKESHLELSK